jgi:hypothetical protein
MSTFRARSYQALPEPGEDTEDSELRQLHPESTPDDRDGHGRSRAFLFSAKSQFARLLRASLIRWFLSLLLTAALIALFRHYSQEPSLTRLLQAQFLITSSVVLLALAMNIQVISFPRSTPRD